MWPTPPTHQIHLPLSLLLINITSVETDKQIALASTQRKKIKKEQNGVVKELLIQDMTALVSKQIQYYNPSC